MFSHIHSTTIAVADQDAALDFYINTFGWEMRADVPFGTGLRWLTISPTGTTTELVLAHTNWTSWQAPATGGGNTGIALVTHDIEAAYQTLTGRGVRFKAPTAALEWGQRATWFYDLDGKAFFLVEA